MAVGRVNQHSDRLDRNVLHKYYLLPSLLLLVVFFIPLWPSYFVVKVEGVPGFDLTRLLIMILMVFWVLSLVERPALRWRVKYEIRSNKKLFMLLSLFFLWKLLTVISSPHASHAVFSALKDIIYYFILFVIALSIWKEKACLHTAVRVMVVSSIFVTAIAMVEYILQYNFVASFAPHAFERLQSAVDVTMRDGLYRTRGTFANPLALSSYVVMLLPISSWLFFESRGKWRILSLISMIGLLSCVYMTGSRTALATLAVLIAGSAFFFLLSWKRKVQGRAKALVAMLLLLAGLIGIAGVSFIGGELAGGRSEKEAGSSDIRLRQIEWGIPLMLSRPFMGYGPGEAGDTLGISTGTVDNYFLTLGLESGFFVAILFAILLFYFLWRSWKLQCLLDKPWAGLSQALFLVVACDVLFMAVISLEQTIPLMFLMFAMICVLSSDANSVLSKRNIKCSENV